jgi:hypothetical protein
MSSEMHRAKAHADHHQTELWLYLPRERRLPKAFAQRTIAAVVRETCLPFAQWTAIMSWTIALSPSLDFSARQRQPAGRHGAGQASDGCSLDGQMQTRQKQ